MRIAILTNAYPPDARGGAGRIAGLYGEELQRRGHEVRVWRARPEFSRLAEMSFMEKLVFHFQDLFPNEPQAREIIAWKPDVLLTHNLTGCGFPTPQAIQKFGARWVHVLHDVQLVEPSGQIITGESFPGIRHFFRSVCSAFRQIVMGKPNMLVSPTKWLIDFHESYGWFSGVAIKIIPNPLPPLEQKNVTRNERDVLFAGRLDPDKGIDTLLAAWEIVKPHAGKLVLVGDGVRSYAVKQRADPSIELCGQVSGEEVLDRMRQAKVVVVPSLVWENQPTVILEALACGCEVIASDVGGVKETLGEAGMIVPPNDVQALAQALKETLEGERRASESAKNEILANHHIDKACDELVNTFDKNEPH
jgi:glycosyltransferase involved in cell wall biosynthesis